MEWDPPRRYIGSRAWVEMANRPTEKHKKGSLSVGRKIETTLFCPTKLLREEVVELNDDST